MFGARFSTICVCLIALAGVAVPAPVQAEPLTLDGRWAAGPLTVRWVIGDWGAACGPRPAGGGEPGAAVVVHQSGGELVIAGGGRTYSTVNCWEQYPGIQRTGHSSSARSWKSTCRTAAGDPRQAALTTTLTATDSSLSLYEAGQYQFVLEGQNCTASVGRYRTYTLVQRAGDPDPVAAAPAPSVEKLKAAPPPPPPEKKPEPAPPSNRCASPGPAARLEVRPARKLLRAGEEFEFRAIVFDGAGCVLYSRPTWAVDSGAEHAELTGPAKVHVLPDAPEGEVRLTASVGGRSALVTIEIASSDRYDGLLRSGAFNAAGEVDEAASVAIASQSIGAASAVAEDRAGGRKRVFVAFVAVVAVLLAIVGVLLVRRNRKAGEAQDFKDAARRERKRLQAHLQDRAAMPAPPAAPSPAAPPPQAAGTLCPICGMQYPAESRFCGKDGATLLPLN